MVKKLTIRQKEVLKSIVNYECEYCHKKETDNNKLHIHRINRGINGGEYVPHNLKIICRKCHLNTHYKEF